MTSDDDKCQPGGGAALSFQTELAQLKHLTGSATDAALASLLGVRPSAVAQWRRRGKVPEKARLKARELASAARRDHRARAYGAGQPPDRVLYARALAIVHCAGGVPTYYNPDREPMDPEALDYHAKRLRMEALYFEETCAAAMLLLDQQAQMHGESAYEAFRKLIGTGYLSMVLESAIRTAEIFGSLGPLPGSKLPAEDLPQ